MTSSFSVSFASDNYAPAHPKFLRAMEAANVRHERAYGDDAWTAAARADFARAFGRPVDVFFVFNGTAANVLSLQAGLKPYSSILCSEWAHIENDECGAPEKFIHAKLRTVPSADGKIRPADLEVHLARRGDQHAVQPGFVSISQSTEYGTVYSPVEIRALADFAHGHNMYLHMDGARITNAAASLNLPLADFTHQAGVDVLSFGGTKAGLVLGEAVVIFNPKLKEGFAFHRKQGMQLSSKMRFLASQFSALLEGDFYRELAGHANRMARQLEAGLCTISGVVINQRVDANAVFVSLPRVDYTALQARYPFYIWKPSINEARLMCAWDTRAEDVEEFLKCLRNTIASGGGSAAIR